MRDGGRVWGEEDVEHHLSPFSFSLSFFSYFQKCRKQFPLILHRLDGLCGTGPGSSRVRHLVSQSHQIVRTLERRGESGKNGRRRRKKRGKKVRCCDVSSTPSEYAPLLAHFYSITLGGGAGEVLPFACSMTCCGSL